RESKNLPNRKSPGLNQITNEMLKHLHATAIQTIVELTNAILRTYYFPPRWKSSNIILIHKSGKDKHDPKSYRPISLLNTMSKLTERIIKTRLEKETRDKKLYPNEQFGFRAQHSTLLQVERITHEIKLNWKKNRQT